MRKDIPPMQRILLAETREKDDATGVFSKIFRSVLETMKIGPKTWNQLMVNYLTDPRMYVGATSKEQSTARGNMNKEFSRPNMTGSVFLKALRFLRCDWVRFEIHLYKDGQYYVAGMDVLNKNSGPVDHDLIESSRDDMSLDETRIAWRAKLEEEHAKRQARKKKIK